MSCLNSLSFATTCENANRVKKKSVSKHRHNQNTHLGDACLNDRNNNVPAVILERKREEHIRVPDIFKTPRVVVESLEPALIVKRRVKPFEIGINFEINITSLLFMLLDKTFVNYLEKPLQYEYGFPARQKRSTTRFSALLIIIPLLGKLQRSELECL